MAVMEHKPLTSQPAGLRVSDLNIPSTDDDADSPPTSKLRSSPIGVRISDLNIPSTDDDAESAQMAHYSPQEKNQDFEVVIRPRAGLNSADYDLVYGERTVDKVLRNLGKADRNQIGLYEVQFQDGHVETVS